MRILVISCLLGLLLACSKPAPQPEPEPQRPSELEIIPEPDPKLYPDWHNLKDWKNPYLIVREDGIGLLDPADSEVRILKPDEVAPALIALPNNQWPYGRVVLVTEAAPHAPTPEAKAEIRKNRGLLVGTLKDLKVTIYQAP